MSGASTSGAPRADATRARHVASLTAGVILGSLDCLRPSKKLTVPSGCRLVLVRGETNANIGMSMSTVASGCRLIVVGGETNANICMSMSLSLGVKV